MMILAIDLGKFNSMCCFWDTRTQQHRFQAAATRRDYLTSVLVNHEIDLVVMEACGPSGWVSDPCAEHGIRTVVCSTNEAAWRFKNVKRKTDKDDALKLARLAIERSKRLVEAGRDVVILLDSLTRLGRASNREMGPGGRTMSGGIDNRALQFPRQFFGAARHCEGSGRLAPLTKVNRLSGLAIS